MKLNTDKCHLLTTGTKYEYILAKIDDDKIWESKEDKHLQSCKKTFVDFFTF